MADIFVFTALNLSQSFKRIIDEFLENWSLMMIIAFNIISSGLVPLIEGLCAQMYYLRFEIIGGLCSHFCVFFRKKKKVKETKQSVQDLIPPPSTYIHACTLYTYTNTYMPRFSPSGLFGPSRGLIPTPGLTSK